MPTIRSVEERPPKGPLLLFVPTCHTRVVKFFRVPQGTLNGKGWSTCWPEANSGS